jgi:hypothetical protein
MLRNAQRQSVRVPAAVLAGLLLVACASSGVARRAPHASFDLPHLCISAQAITSGSSVVPQVIVHTDYDAFVKSKPVARPLQLEQYVWYADDSHQQPRMVSCKMKTADHLQAEYGANAAGTEASCAAVNERILKSLLSGMSRAERLRLRFDQGRNIVFDADDVTNDGPSWLKPFSIAYADAQGRLHLKSKGMQNDWLDPRYLSAPVKFRGTRYCHLVAPPYLARVLRGDIEPELPPP